jgi:hypothetical protein
VRLWIRLLEGVRWDERTPSARSKPSTWAAAPQVIRPRALHLLGTNGWYTFRRLSSQQTASLPASLL